MSNKGFSWTTLARIMSALTGAASTSACDTRFDSRAASDYLGRPSRVVIMGTYHPGMDRGSMQHFHDTLVRSVEACGIKVAQQPASTNSARDVVNPQIDDDAELTYRTVSYAATPWLHHVKSEMFEALVVELPTRRIVWRGTFGIENEFFDFTTGRVARDLISRLAADGILKACVRTP